MFHVVFCSLSNDNEQNDKSKTFLQIIFVVSFVNVISVNALVLICFPLMSNVGLWVNEKQLLNNLPTNIPLVQ